ncbi:MAG: endonuclease/exonuclease/phosphatase family protein [Deltaproteobacteria bacterium]|nr:endonuclease/exonuclease/phosphatase family protein [Deltaproteobacteria bacterium]
MAARLTPLGLARSAEPPKPEMTFPDLLLGPQEAPGPIDVPVRDLGVRVASGRPSELTVVTWNIAWGFGWGSEGRQKQAPKSAERLIRTLTEMGSTLANVGADLALLQEVDFASARSHDLDEAEIIAKSSGLRYVAPIVTWRSNFVPYPSWRPSNWWGHIVSGGAILSRHPMTSAFGELLPKPKNQPFWYRPFYPFRFMSCASVELPGRALRVVNVHLEAFDAENRMDQARRIAARLRSLDSVTLLGGDFNTVPPEALARHGFVDEPKTDFRSDETMLILRELLEPSRGTELGRARSALSDVMSRARSGQESFTFPSHAPNRRLDHLFHDESLVLREARVMKEAGTLSDHLPVIARFS